MFPVYKESCRSVGDVRLCVCGVYVRMFYGVFLIIFSLVVCIPAFKKSPFLSNLCVLLYRSEISFGDFTS